MQRLRKRNFVIALIFVGLVGLRMELGRIIQKSIELAAPRTLGVPVTMDDVSLSLLRGTITATHVIVANPKGFAVTNLCELGRLEINIAMTKLFSNPMRIDDILIDRPVFTYERKDGKSNVAALQESIDASTRTEPASAQAYKPTTTRTLAIDRLRIRNATARLNLDSLTQSSMVVSIPNLELTHLGDSKKGETPGEITAAALAAISPDIGKSLSHVGSEIGSAADGAIRSLSSGANNLIEHADGGLRDAAKGLQGILEGKR